ncbi:MAG: hypothetical protein P0Y59_15015 [Candidatus Sphingomonas phytovorans]|nr:hypothetical protein [Sphingomonas sp.]WEJ98253.1 MAG: hypothetical protein P0Y59_15015 [Sphingomonas sp.]
MVRILIAAGTLLVTSIIFILLIQNIILVNIGCSASNVRVVGVTVLEYRVHSVNLFGNNFTVFKVGTDDGPDIVFTREHGLRPERHNLGYVTSGALDHYYIPCRTIDIGREAGQ